MSHPRRRILATLAATAFVLAGLSGGLALAADAPPPGPPFPTPETDRAVYDFAGIFSEQAIATAEAIIDAIEERTAAEIVVYTQAAGYYGITTDETLRRVTALIDQWGVGRAGFDDGAAIFFDLDPSMEHGQVQIYGAPGYEAAFLSNEERQAIFDDDMVPFLRIADFDAALLAALRKMDAAATPEHARALALGRQVNAVVGLFGAPIVFLLVVGTTLFHWQRYGRDPVYLDSPSILMPAPPADLTAASAAMVVEGAPTRRALTAALLDIASRGLMAFRDDPGFLGLGRKVGIDLGGAVDEPPADPDAATRRAFLRARAARKPLGPAEKYAYDRLSALAGKRGDMYIPPDDLPEFGTSVEKFNNALERHVVSEGWFGEAPSKVRNRWYTRAIFIGVGGAVGIGIGMEIPFAGLVMLGGAAIAAAIITAIMASHMPAVTMPGAMIRAMLAAYRRTLKKTMEQARSMQQVVDEAGLEWLDTPDQAVVWGTALGLQDEIEAVLKRSMDDVKAGRADASSTYFPNWYHSSSSTPLSSGAASGSGGSIFSGSAIPSIGGMMATLGTIGNAPSSSGGSGGGGGFSGGSSGGGGGGAGGGF
jgi:uncharacterized membrane protein YgcG